MQGTEFCCTMNSEEGNRKDANTECTRSVGGNRNSRRERESWCTYVCDMSGVQNARRRTEKGDFCTLDRFWADGARTRATRVIRWRVLGVRAANGGTEGMRAGRPGDSWTQRKQCVCVGVRCVFRMAGTQGPFHGPPQIKPRDEVKS